MKINCIQPGLHHFVYLTPTMSLVQMFLEVPEVIKQCRQRHQNKTSPEMSSQSAPRPR